MWNKNERQGTVDQAKGKVKQAVGALTNDDDLRAPGRAFFFDSSMQKD